MKKILWVLLFTLFVSCGNNSTSLMNQVKKEVKLQNGQIYDLIFSGEIKFLNEGIAYFTSVEAEIESTWSAEEKELFDKGLTEFKKLVSIMESSEKEIKSNKIYGEFDSTNTCKEDCFIFIEFKDSVSFSDVNTEAINDLMDMIYENKFVYFYTNKNVFVDLTGEMINQKDKLIEIVNNNIK